MDKRNRPPVCGRQVRRNRPPVCGKQVRRNRPPVCGRQVRRGDRCTVGVKKVPTAFVLYGGTTYFCATVSFPCYARAVMIECNIATVSFLPRGVLQLPSVFSLECERRTSRGSTYYDLIRQANKEKRFAALVRATCFHYDNSILTIILSAKQCDNT